MPNRRFNTAFTGKIHTNTKCCYFYISKYNLNMYLIKSVFFKNNAVKNYNYNEG